MLTTTPDRQVRHDNAGAPMRQHVLWPMPLYLYRDDPGSDPDGHDLLTKAKVAESIADFLGCSWGGQWQGGRPDPRCGTACYLVPSEPIVGLQRAGELGVTGIDHLFGSVVPHAFVATKVISHPLLRSGSPAPAGWRADFAARTRDAVLPGYTVFSPDDARQAGELLLQGGSVRVKHPHGVGGTGQWVVEAGDELQHRLADFGRDELAQHGLVLERNLRQVVTYSVGQVQVGGLTLSYHGTQSLTENHRGEQVYGGSRLHVVRGCLADLLRLDLLPSARLAVEQALCYHEAALQCFEGMFASRCNYDVAQGVDDLGQALSGVLEPSWRIGGASGAEVVALHAFDADPQLNRLLASTTERYAADVQLPAGAWLLYDGADAGGGRLVKYAQVVADAHA